jgi:hypothetical protein
MPIEEKPSRNEDEYFNKQDAELVKEMRARLDKERAQSERKSHFMKCPKCGADLKEVEQHSVKVDICPDCHGLWLDAGEIDILRTSTKKGATFVDDLFGMFSRGGGRK